MADIGAAVGRLTPSITSGGLAMTIMLILFLIVAIIIIGVIGYLIYIWKVYNNKIIITEKVGDKDVIVGRDTARIIKLNNQGDVAFYLRKRKKTIPKGNIQIAPKTFLFRVRSDDEWINTDLGDIDLESKKIGVHFLDKEMRFARTQLSRGLKEEFDKYSWIQQIIAPVMYTVLIMVVGISIWLLFREWTALAGIINSAMDTAARVMENQEQILNSLENLCNGGAGFKTIK